MRVLCLLFAMISMAGCTQKKQIWIYTSLYKEVIAEMDAAVHSVVPEAEIKWFQGGSENVAAKLNAELAAGRTKADLVITSDPFWYLDLKQQGNLLPYDSPAAREVPAAFKDPDHAFTTVRIPVMVLGYNTEAFKPTELPASWKDLTAPKWKNQVSMGSPLESGTSFTFVAMLARTLGWDFFTGLRAGHIVAAGGNSSVITRIETRERPIGIVLLENILKAQAKGSPVRPIYPSDGAIPVPSPIAILKDSAEPELAKKVYDWFFSPAAQLAIVHGGMYSPIPKTLAPDNARPWAELVKQMPAWTPAVAAEVVAARDQVKAKFSEVVLH